MWIYTIGAYGFTEEEFFDRLVRASVDTFCDIRRRRGMRGKEYAFANSARLQARLAELGIRYVHIRDLAPTEAVRAAQNRAERASRTAKRERANLAPQFIEAYERECLASLTCERFIEYVTGSARAVVLFCVERQPAACHRSLVAERLASVCRCEVKHLQ
jgi:uncharacterized protein (DUF488 family)